LELDAKKNLPDIPPELLLEIVRLLMNDETIAYPTNPGDNACNMAGGIQSQHRIQANGSPRAYNGMQSIARLRAASRHLHAISAEPI
jgi:hypothetical protein